MPAMPYVFEIGTMLGVLADASEDRALLLELHEQLRNDTKWEDGTDLESLRGLDATLFDEVPDPQAKGYLISGGNHLRRDWIGQPAIVANPDPRWNPPAEQIRSPWWVGWRSGTLQQRADGTSTVTPDNGVGKILRLTLMSAIEVSLGMLRDGTPCVAAATDQHWPIDYHWVCGAPLFQGWVSWRKLGAGARLGHVVVTLTTPGNGEPMYASPRLSAISPERADYSENTEQEPYGDFGTWVIGQPEVALRHEYDGTTEPPQDNVLQHPYGSGELFVTSGEPIRIRPAQFDGGLDADAAAHSYVRKP